VSSVTVDLENPDKTPYRGVITIGSAPPIVPLETGPYRPTNVESSVLVGAVTVSRIGYIFSFCASILS